MSKLEPRIEAVRAKYDLSVDDFWQIPQNKQWVCKHAALEVVATKANVIWTKLEIIEADTANGIAVLVVGGKLGDREEWATGEASPKNNKNAYPWAMAEKRSKDRVVLKLVGIHGLVYSEDELATPQDEPRTTDQRSESGRREVAKTSAQEPKQSQTKTNRLSKDKSRDLYERMQKDLEDCANEGPDTISSLMQSNEMLADLASLPEDWEKKITEDARALYKTTKEFFDSKKSEGVDAKKYIEDNFPGAGELKGNG